MAIALARIDDRLIHGQVVIGWGVPLGVRLIALVDDDVAANAWEQEIYRMAVPPGVEVEFVTRDAAIASAPPPGKAIRGPCSCSPGPWRRWPALVRGGQGVLRRVNIGGLHAGPGRRERLRYVYLTDAEAAALARARGRGHRGERAGRPHVRAGPDAGPALDAGTAGRRFAAGVGHDRRGRPGELSPRRCSTGRWWPRRSTGFLIGDLEAGLRIGLLLECFALDVIPIGATRYPDFGPASVVATAAVPLAGWQDATGLGVMIALLLALAGGKRDGIRATAERQARARGDARARLGRSGGPRATAADRAPGRRAPEPHRDARRDCCSRGSSCPGSAGWAMRAARSGWSAWRARWSPRSPVRCVEPAAALPRVLLSIGLLLGGLFAWLA